MEVRLADRAPPDGNALHSDDKLFAHRLLESPPPPAPHSTVWRADERESNDDAQEAGEEKPSKREQSSSNS